MQTHRYLPLLGAAAALLFIPAPSTLRAQGAVPPPPDDEETTTAVPRAPLRAGTAAIPGTPARLPRQTPGNGVSTVRANPAAAAPPSGVPGPLAGEETVRLQFPNATVSDILDHYALLTGKRVLPDNTIQGSINLMINTPVPRSEAVRIIEVALSLNGFTLIQVDDNIVKVLGLGKPARNEGIPIYSDLDLLPNSEQVVSFLIRPRYLDPQETAGALTQYVPPNNRVAFTALEKAGALIITDTAASVRRLVSLLNQIDLPSAPVVEKFLRLERADATKAVEFLNTVFDIKGGGTAGQGNVAASPVSINPTRRPIRRVNESGDGANDGGVQPIGNPLGGLPVLSGDSLIQGKIILTPDVRTNRVHVVTSPLNMPLVERLLEEYDADTPFAQPVRYPLRFVRAKDALTILVQALAEPGTDTNGTGSSGGSTGRTSVNNNPTASNTSNNPFSSLNGSSTSFGGGGGGGSGSSSVGNSELDTQPVDTTPTIATVGNTKLIADQQSNTIIVLGGAEARDKVQETIRQLDIRPSQVVIRTVIGELSLGQNSELGFNYLLRTNRGSILSNANPGFLSGTTASTATGTTTGTTTGTGTGTTTGTTSSNLSTLTDLATGLAGVGSSFSGVGGILAIGKSFEIILSALESTSRFKTISRPMIFTSNNKKAIIASGQEIAVPTNSVGTTTGTTTGSVGTYTNIDYKNVTLQLEVVPLINSDHEVTLDILQKIDSLVAGSNTVVNGNSVPTIATRYLKSTVSAPNNSTIVLGGLITQDENKTSGDIPYLSKIPILGDLFRSKTKGADRSELIILMHPEVINSPGLLVQTRKNEERRTYLGGDLENQLLPNEVRKAIPVKQETVVVKKTVVKTTAK